MKISTSTALAEYMKAFQGEIVKIVSIEDTSDHVADNGGYTIKKVTLSRGLNGDNTVISTISSQYLIPLDIMILRMEETIDVQRLQTYESNGGTYYRYRYAEEASSRDRFRLSDPESFMYATSDKPSFYKENAIMKILPDLLTDEDWVVTCGVTPSYIGIDVSGYRLDGVPEKYESAVVLYAALKVVTRLWENTIKNEEDAELGQGYAQLMQNIQLQYIASLQIPPSKQDKDIVQQQTGRRG